MLGVAVFLIRFLNAIIVSVRLLLQVEWRFAVIQEGFALCLFSIGNRISICVVRSTSSQIVGVFSGTLCVVECGLSVLLGRISVKGKLFLRTQITRITSII